MTPDAAGFGHQVEIIYNPHAGRFDRHALDALVDAFSVRGMRVVARPGRPGDPLAIDPATGLVCIFGGDGTARDVLSAMRDAHCQLPVCVYPSGTVNLIARELGYPRNPRAFVERVLDMARNTRCHGVSMAQGRCIACASIGLDSHVVARVSAKLKRRIGRFAYVWAMLTLLWRWPRQRLDVMVDGTAFQCEAVFLLNGRYYAGPWRLARAASLDQRGMWVLMMRRAWRRDIVAAGLAMMAGRDLATLDNIELRSARSVDVSSADGAPVPVQADGDVVGHLPVRFVTDDSCIVFA